MYCPNCGAENSEDATYCANCGSDLRKIETPGMDVPPPPQPGPQPGTQPSYAPQSAQASVPNYLVQAILTTVFCCLPLGIVSTPGLSGAARTQLLALWTDPPAPQSGWD